MSKIKEKDEVCPKCGGLLGMCEYPLTSKYHYDGVSEVVCMAEGCGYRRGRWCGNELAEGEFEPPHHEGDTHPRVFDL